MTEKITLDIMAPDDTDRRQLILEYSFVFLVVAASFVVRVWGLSKVHYWDETVYLQNAEVICCGKANYSELGFRPPLLSLFFSTAFLFWHHVYAACIATALLNALGPALLFVCGRRIAGTVPAAIASLLLAFSPFFVGVIQPGFESNNTGNSLLSDCPALTLILLSFWLLLRALDTQTDLRFACAGLALALSVLMRFASLSSVGMLSLLVLRADRRGRAAAACGIGFAVGIGPYLCWSRFRYGGFLKTFLTGWTKFEGPAESPFFYLRHFSDIFSWIAFAGLALWIVNRATEKWKLKRRGHLASPYKSGAEQNSRELELFLWLWAAVLLVFFSILTHKEPRYVIPLAPPLLLLAGIGLSAVLKCSRKTVRIAGTLLLVVALAYTFLPTADVFQTPLIDDEVTEEMQASDFMNHSLSPATVLYATVDYPVFAYYTNLQVRPVRGTGAKLYDSLDRLPDDGVFIAFKDRDTSEGPRLSWLDTNSHFQRLREYPSLVLYNYRVRNGR